LEPVFTVVIASLASLLACGGLVVLVEALRDRFQTLDEVSVATEKPVLGLTPDPPSGLRWRWRRWRKPESITPGWEQRADPIWERATLLADRLAPQQTDKAASSDPGARSAVVIGLISPVYPQRAAFVGRHMAAAWAGRGERVLIVDTTFKSQLFVDEGQKLLSEADARHPTPITGLEMMNWPFSNAEVGHLDETRRLLDRLAPLRSTQDRIVLILPPLLDEQGSLSRIEIPDRLIMVLRLGETSRKHFRQAMEVITLTEAHMQALVVVDG
jgi:hypothetical protein